MERTTEPTLPKILLSYEEFQRLKHIEVQYIELQDKIQTQQIGKGIDEKEIERLKNIEKQFNLLQKNEDQKGQGSIFKDLRPPIASKNDSLNTVQTPFDVVISKDDENSSFDEKELLKFVPQEHLKKAKLLIEELEKQPFNITWDSSGIVFIKSIAVPNSNIYKYLPALFKKTKSDLVGFDDFLQALYDIGLQQYIAFPMTFSKNAKEEVNILPHIDENISGQWWYIGD